MIRFLVLRRVLAVAVIVTGGAATAACREGRNQGNQFLSLSGPRSAPTALVYSCLKRFSPSHLALWTVHEHRKADLLWEEALRPGPEDVHRVPVNLARTSPGGLVDGRYLLEMRSERGSLNFLDFVAEELRQDELLVDSSLWSASCARAALRGQGRAGLPMIYRFDDTPVC